MPARRYEYYAKADALHGGFERPYDETLSSGTALTLPIEGGFQSAEIFKFNYRNIVRFDRAYTYVAGNEGPEGTFNTMATAVVEGLNVADVLTADRVIARLVSEVGPDATSNDETGIWPIGSRFENLRVFGREVTPVPGAAFEKANMADALLKAARTHVSKDRTSSARALTGASAKFAEPVKVATLFEPLVSKKTLYAAEDNVLVIPTFGKVWLGELVIARGRRRLSMLRLQLGSPLGTSRDGFTRDLVVCSGEGNGVIPGGGPG